MMIDEAIRRIAALLPGSWMVEDRARILPGDAGAGAVIDLVANKGQRISFAVEAKRSGRASVPNIVSIMRDLERSAARPVLYVSDYIGPSLREALAAAGINYADATGWVRIASDTPLVMLTGQGAAKSPRAGKSTVVARLSGVAAGRIVRALSVQGAPLGVRDLATRAGVSPGSVSKLLPTLASEGIIDRDDRGGVATVRRRALVKRWARDYGFAKTNPSVGYFLAPRGLDRTLARLADLSTPITLTGSAAARRLLPAGATPVVPLRLLALYAGAPSALVDELGLVPAEPATANTVVAIPQDGEVLNSEIAPVALVLADLLTLPGRGDAEVEQLMDSLAQTDQAWEA
ncbi:MAG: helix-turn-helix domain-containing protein [Nocardioidaceae bacterium]